MSDTERGNERPPPSPMRFLGIGSELVIPILVGVYVGYRVDEWLGTAPWALLGLSILGIVTGFVQFFRSVLPPRPNRSDGSDGSSGSQDS